MSPDEWDSLHPDHCIELQKAWIEKQKRKARSLASLQLTIAQVGGAKKNSGGRLKLEDFLPEFAKDKKKDPETEEKTLQNWFKALSRKTRPDGK